MEKLFLRGNMEALSPRFLGPGSWMNNKQTLPFDRHRFQQHSGYAVVFYNKLAGKMVSQEQTSHLTHASVIPVTPRHVTFRRELTLSPSLPSTCKPFDTLQNPSVGDLSPESTKGHCSV